jgi:hypothetical protein
MGISFFAPRASAGQRAWSCGLYANAYIHHSPEADVRGGEAPAASGRLSGILDGCRDQRRIFFMIFTLTKGEVWVISGALRLPFVS